MSIHASTGNIPENFPKECIVCVEGIIEVQSIVHMLKQAGNGINSFQSKVFKTENNISGKSESVSINDDSDGKF